MRLATVVAVPDATLPVDGFDDVVETAITQFLSGETDGHDLLDALYGDVVDEPIPAAILALVRKPKAG